MQGSIAGFVPVSIGEFDENSCALLFLAGCNLRCSYCHNNHILDAKDMHRKDLKDVKKELERSAPFADALVFCGAEPTLQRQTLLTVARWARELGMKVALQTNGTRPEVIRELVQEQLLDHVILDIKSPFEPELFTRITRLTTTFKPAYETMQDIKATIDFLAKVPISKVIRTTVLPTLMYRKEHLTDIASSIYNLGCVWELRPFVSTPTVHPRFRHIHPPSEEFMKDLQAYLQQRFPMLTIRIVNEKNMTPTAPDHIILESSR
jgi:pyruvate formate lyase activating enzyme